MRTYIERYVITTTLNPMILPFQPLLARLPNDEVDSFLKRIVVFPTDNAVNPSSEESASEELQTHLVLLTTSRKHLPSPKLRLFRSKWLDLILSTKHLTLRSNLDPVTLKNFSMLGLTHFCAMKVAENDLESVISTQKSLGTGGSEDMLMGLLVPFSQSEVLEILEAVTKAAERNWRNILSLAVTFIHCFDEAELSLDCMAT